jgi:ribosomal protein L14E/L6E/L27E
LFSIFKRGEIVLSLAGRNKGKLLAVLSADTESVLAADGKEYPIERPKKKNNKHIRKTRFAPLEFSTDRALRRELAARAGSTVSDETEV